MSLLIVGVIFFKLYTVFDIGIKLKVLLDVPFITTSIKYLLFNSDFLQLFNRFDCTFYVVTVEGVRTVIRTLSLTRTICKDSLTYRLI